MTKSKKITYSALLIIVIFSSVFFCIQYYNKVISEKYTLEIYANENLEKEASDWTVRAVDSKILPCYIENKINKIVKVSKNKFLAPHFVVPIDNKKIPESKFVVHFKILIPEKNTDACTLASISLPTEPIVLVMNDMGLLGITHNIFQKPIYSDKKYSSVKTGKWEDIYIYANSKEKKNKIFINKKLVLEEDWNGATYPLNEITFGSFWINGAGSYYAMQDVSYADISIGNEGLLK